MKAIFLVGILLLVGCSKQDSSNQMTGFEQANAELNVKETLSSVEQKQKLAGTYSNNDPAVRLSSLEMVAILKTLYPTFALESMTEKQRFQMTASDTGKVKPFQPFHDWVSIKVIYREPNQNLHHIAVEIYDQASYKESKQKTFDMCKNIWKGIDARIPEVIDELSDRIKNYEKSDSLAMTSYTRYGYLFSLDASHYRDGYPVACNIGYDQS
ncbi:hypothetical protein [Acinetobacter nectaris]|uniref:hypothetical protein n=1 Tax=Acinetobacter nectaris TaxID=1219382 RepID=UPI001F37A9AC|nr:hypothetical protein [Acinetobacter nectaris]MCF8999279.1 hypothetical protein [Acinetobacter nectaris]MCF9028114.1 hypothetical protein [Acinetobacter nectaris]